MINEMKYGGPFGRSTLTSQFEMNEVNADDGFVTITLRKDVVRHVSDQLLMTTDACPRMNCVRAIGHQLATMDQFLHGRMTDIDVVTRFADVAVLNDVEYGRNAEVNDEANDSEVEEHNSRLIHA